MLLHLKLRKFELEQTSSELQFCQFRIKKVYPDHTMTRISEILTATVPDDILYGCGQPYRSTETLRSVAKTNAASLTAWHARWWQCKRQFNFRSPLRRRGVKLDGTGSSTTRHSSATTKTRRRVPTFSSLAIHTHASSSPNRPCAHAWKLCERDGWSDREIDRAHRGSGSGWPGRRPLARFHPLVLASAYVTAICRPLAAAGIRIDASSTADRAGRRRRVWRVIGTSSSNLRCLHCSSPSAGKTRRPLLFVSQLDKTLYALCFAGNFNLDQVIYLAIIFWKTYLAIISDGRKTAYPC